MWIYGSDMDGESMKNVILQLVMAFVGSLACHAVSFNESIMDISISGRSFLLGRISSCDVFQ